MGKMMGKVQSLVLALAVTGFAGFASAEEPSEGPTLKSYAANFETEVVMNDVSDDGQTQTSTYKGKCRAVFVVSEAPDFIEISNDGDIVCVKEGETKETYENETLAADYGFERSGSDLFATLDSSGPLKVGTFSDGKIQVQVDHTSKEEGESWSVKLTMEADLNQAPRKFRVVNFSGGELGNITITSSGTLEPIETSN